MDEKKNGNITHAFEKEIGVKRCIFFRTFVPSFFSKFLKVKI